MICDKCRTLNPNENTKCVRCGNKLEAPQINPQAPKSLYQYNKTNLNLQEDRANFKSGKHREKRAFNSSPIILIAGLIATGALFYHKKDMAVDYWQNNIRQWFMEPESLVVKNPTTDSTASAFSDSPANQIKQSKSAVKKSGDKDIDYYQIMKEQGITENTPLSDTTIYESRSQGASAQQLRKKIRREGGKFFGVDNKEMMLIPAQTFIMGTNNGNSYEGPAHEISIGSFYIDAKEVTNTEFKRFLNITGYKPKGSLAHLHDARFNNPYQPVVDIAYEDAIAYCEWTGKRLPTEAEWECAAKGGRQFIYPTGNIISNVNAVYGSGLNAPKATGSLKPNLYGVYDLAGNAAEIVSGKFKLYPGNSDAKNEYKNSYICRGGSWLSSTEDLKCTRRVPLGSSGSSGNIGFRCAVSAE